MKCLKFRPLLKRLRWGGRRLGTVLGKPIGPESDYAESWEVCDHGGDQTVVATGEFAGWTLQRLVRERPDDLLGVHAGLTQFPLLIKFLDAHDRLSVQVHPDDAAARARHPEWRGKTESWVIVDAAPGACVYVGLLNGVEREHLSESLGRGAVEDHLHRIPVKRGDCLFIPAGTVHAIGEGVLLAEVQQTSDLTYRLFDWNRVGTDGRPRPLHIDESLACTDFSRGPVALVEPQLLSDRPGARVEQLVDCPYFVIRRHTAKETVPMAEADRCRILMVLEGGVAALGDDEVCQVGRGETAVVPASCPALTLKPAGEATWLEVFWR